LAQRLDDGSVGKHVSRHVDLLRGLTDQGNVDPLQVLAGRVVDLLPRAAPFKRTRQDLRDERGRTIAGRRLNVGFIGTFDLKISVYEGLRSLVAGPDSAGAYRPGTLHLPDWIGEDEMQQLTAEVLIDPRDYEAAANTKRRGALVKTGERREWRKRPHQPNEALDIVVGARAMAWGCGAGALAPSDWRERAAEAHGALEQPTLFSAPLVAPGTPAKASPPARGVSAEQQIEQIQRAVVARGAASVRAWPPRRTPCPTN
jgi:phage terminase large subunit GpA-like protein